MKKLILLFILLQVSLFANKFIGIGYQSATAKLEEEIKLNANSYDISYNIINSKYMLGISTGMTPSQSPFSIKGEAVSSVTIKGYSTSVSFAYKAYNKNEIFIAPSVSLGYFSSTTISNKEEESIEKPLVLGIMIGVDYDKDSFAFMQYYFYKTDLAKSNSTESESKLLLGLSHNINDDFSIQSSYGISFDNESPIKSSNALFIGVGYSL